MYFADFSEKYMRRKRYGTPYTKIRENYEKNITLRYLLIVVVIKYSLLNPRCRKPEVEVVENRQFISTPRSRTDS